MFIMDIKELDKKQLILLTLLITFVVSIATGIVTVSLMNQMPSNVPQTINNVIQRTIERVTTVEIPLSEEKKKGNDLSFSENKNTQHNMFFDNGEILVSIYNKNIEKNKEEVSSDDKFLDLTNEEKVEEKPVGQGVLISETGLILVDSSIIKEERLYQVMLGKDYFPILILKKFDNGFTIIKILPKIKTEDSSQLETR